MMETVAKAGKVKRSYDWYLAYTESQCEYHAAFWLQRKGFMTFFPEYKPRNRRRGKSKVKEPVFPNYVFVGEVPGVERDRFGEIEATSGVLCLLRIDSVPLKVPDAVVGELREAAMKQQFVEDEKRGGVRYVREGITAADLAKFKLNDEVLVTRGPFASFVGRIVRMGGRNEIGVLLKIFNTETLVRFTEKQIEPLDDAPTNQSVSRSATAA
jgi:transcription antitermination factor NusG